MSDMFEELTENGPQTKGFIIPSSPADRKAIMDAIIEVSSSMTRIEGEKDLIKEAINDLSDKFKIPKRILNRFARTYHKQNYDEVIGQDEDFETLVDTLVKPSNS